MKIVGLQAENVKRLRAVEFEPDGTLQVVTGKNGQGKSSLLDAIYLALAGREAAKETVMPIRRGERKARVRLDLGELVVTRSWSPSGSKLRVEAQGEQVRSPQALLDSLVGAIGFDPLAFTRMTPKEQQAMLLELLGIDFEALDAEREQVYDQRRDFGRELKALGEVVQVADDAPMEEKSASALIARIREVDHHNTTYYEVVDDVESLIAKKNRLEAELETVLEAISEGEEFLEANEPIMVEPLHEELASVEEHNAQVRVNKSNLERAIQASRLNRQISKATQRLREIDREKQALVEAARFPVEGLGFDEDGVTFNGVPLSQASSAEQIRVSVGVGMAMSPDLRVLMVKDGSLLDSDSFDVLHQMAVDNDFQVFVETVNSDEPLAIVIEDGAISE